MAKRSPSEHIPCVPEHSPLLFHIPFRIIKFIINGLLTDRYSYAFLKQVLQLASLLTSGPQGVAFCLSLNKILFCVYKLKGPFVPETLIRDYIRMQASLHCEQNHCPNLKKKKKDREGGICFWAVEFPTNSWVHLPCCCPCWFCHWYLNQLFWAFDMDWRPVAG